MSYAVQPGDTLYSIARAHNLSTNQLLSLNNWSTPPTLQIGQNIIVNNTIENSSNEDIIHIVAQGDSLYSIAKKYNVGPADIIEENDLDPNNGIYIGQELYIPELESDEEKNIVSSTSSNIQKHIVLKGDSLYSISRKYNVTPQQLLEKNQMQPNSPIYIGQILFIPTSDSNGSEIVSEQKETTIKKKTPPEVYTVLQGDTLYQISQKFGISPQKILELNGFDSSQPIYVGQQLKVKNNGKAKVIPPPKKQPSSSQKSHTVSSGESLYAIGRKYDLSPAEILSANNMSIGATIYVGQVLTIPSPQLNVKPKVTPTTKEEVNVYTVQSGDFLSKIAKKYNITPQELVAANHIPKGRIYVGQKLFIPTSKNNSSPQNNSVKQAQGNSIYQLSKIDGQQLFSKGLYSRIGTNYSIHPTDLDNVQKRLVQLGILHGQHNESPRNVGGNTNNISGQRVPKTMAAIRKLQDRYRLNWWVGSPSRTEMLDTDKYTYGEIVPNDVTFKFLKEYTQYTLSFPHPITGQTQTAEFSNFVYSGYNQFYNGVGYLGKSLPNEVPLSVFKEAGLSPILAEAMKVVSSHEGNFDAINSYDKAFFSYGFIQFAGGGRGLAPLIARMKVTEPALFGSIFQNAGIDVEYTTRNNDIHQGELIINFPGKGTLKGIDAEKELRNHHQMYGPFIRAAFHPKLIKAQIIQAVKAYATPALGIKLSINTGQFNQSNIPITDIINSPMGLGFAIDMTVNKWIVKTGEMFNNAISSLCKQKGWHQLHQISMIDEREVLQEIVRQEGGADKRVSDRGNSMLKSSLSYSKDPQKGKGLLA
ncbi:LysM peptidoglycan-binding domain-containing protein [Flammeovirga sp. MY04]|uniref:muramidase family protein n=1 Tax=Flammeovirga sp. MY04 TaxID=1191459 RepID=UPI0008060ECA|nr:LysM peptidoglycan-binding domain-containing protein [Flammeovirga sp. MY04]ANQ49160.1 LysM peptidoglycan-binding domain-containing protein [Flammeovirga sp. MY04]